MEDYKRLTNRQVKLYYLILTYCPIKFIKRNIENKLEYDMNYIIKKAGNVLREGILKR